MNQTLQHTLRADATSAPSTGVYHRMARTRLLFMFFCIVFAILPNIQIKSALTDYVDVSSGGATAYFCYENHFYKGVWTNINTDETTSLKLDIWIQYNSLCAERNNNDNSFLNLYKAAAERDFVPISNLTSLASGASLSLYTTFTGVAKNT